MINDEESEKAVNEHKLANEGIADDSRELESAKVEVGTGIETLKANHEVTENPTSTGGWCYLKIGIVVVFLMIVAIILIAKFGVSGSTTGDKPTPITVSFETGISLVTYYSVSTTVRSRLVQTRILMEVSNAMDCMSVHSVTLQLPATTRITHLQNIAHETQCKTVGKAEKLEQARETFVETAIQGLPGAYVEQRDATTYSIQAVVNPFGKTEVEVVLEDVLRQRVGQVDFQIPFMPLEKIEQVHFEFDIDDLSGSQTMFQLDFGRSANVQLWNDNLSFNTTVIGDIPNARDYTLPNIVRGSYVPSEIPGGGIFLTDRDCFEHIFKPSDLEPIPKNLVLLLDVSFSMATQSKLSQSKRAIEQIVQLLSDEDHLVIQAFGEKTVEDFWGTLPATSENKRKAIEFVYGLTTRSSSVTNLYEGLLQGMNRFEGFRNRENAVNILVLITDSMPPQTGIDERSRIANAVLRSNERRNAKIFTLGLPGADVEFMEALAVMNGGVSIPILDAGQSFADQIVGFFQSEIGNVVLYDLKTTLPEGGVVEAWQTTGFNFPVLSVGTEVVIRGLLNETAAEASFMAETTAMTSSGIQTWKFTPDLSASAFSSGRGTASRCFQAFAHSRISQLLRFRDASKVVSNELMQQIVQLSEDCNTEHGTTYTDCIVEEARKWALQANLVVKGLTAMSTVADDNCLTPDEDTAICKSGTYGSSYWSENEIPPPPGLGSGGGSFQSGSSKRPWDPHVMFLLTMLMVGVGWVW